MNYACLFLQWDKIQDFIYFETFLKQKYFLYFCPQKQASKWILQVDYCSEKLYLKFHI